MTASVAGNGEPASASTPAPAGSQAEAGVDATSTVVRPRPKALVLLGSTALAAVAFDQVTKQLVLSELANHDPVRLLGGALYLNVTRNPGAAFSIGEEFTFVFPIIALVVFAGVIWLARQLRSVPWAVAMGLVVGGALGNVIDRIFRAPAPLHGHVVDFLSLFDEAGRVWPIFNVADSALFCGVVLAIFLEFTGRRRDGTREPAKARSGDPG
ncbi:MAG TPA: signal peptidase II [Micromonosporaceae bacterium]